MRYGTRFLRATAALLAAGAGLSAATGRAKIATFDDLTLPANSYWNGSDLSGTQEVVPDPWNPPFGTMDLYQGGFVSGGIFFNNTYNATYSALYSSPIWSGWAYSNTTNVSTPGPGNESSAITGCGWNGSSNYGVALCGSPTVSFSHPTTVQGAYFTNTTYAYLSMLNGDSFAKKFGGPSGNDPDWFKLTITGMDAGGGITGTKDFYLADYRFMDNAQDYLIKDWTWVDLTGLGTNVSELEFSLDSSDHFIDNGYDYGMNTPAYFAIDNLTTAPEPGTLCLAAIGLGMAGLAWRWRRPSAARGCSK